MRTARTITLRMAAAIAIMVLCAASPQTPKKEPEPEWSTWLVRAHFVHRQNPQGDSDELRQLQAQLDAATRPADKRRIQRQIDDAKKNADQRRGYVIYGWSVQADAAGKPVESSRALTGFFVEHSVENARAIGSLKPGAALALDRTDSKELFTLGGRRWRAVQRAAIIKNAADIGDPPGLKPPPDAPLTEAQKQAIGVSLTFHDSKPSESGGVSHRYTIKVNAESAPANATALSLWVAMSISVDGTRLGPIIEDFEVPRTQSGGFAIARSADLIARPGVRIDGEASAVEPVAMAWSQR